MEAEKGVETGGVATTAGCLLGVGVAISKSRIGWVNAYIEGAWNVHHCCYKRSSRRSCGQFAESTAMMRVPEAAACEDILVLYKVHIESTKSMEY